MSFLGFVDKSAFKWSEFVVPSSLQLSSLIETLLEPVDSKEIFLQLELGLHEALVNAVVHGNAGDPNKLVRIRRILTPNWFVWQIQDQGDGIPLNARVDSLPSRVDSISGRGLFLIHQCFDDVRWSRRGNRLQLGCSRVKKFVSA